MPPQLDQVSVALAQSNIDAAEQLRLQNIQLDLCQLLELKIEQLQSFKPILQEHNTKTPEQVRQEEEWALFKVSSDQTYCNT